MDFDFEVAAKRLEKDANKRKSALLEKKTLAEKAARRREQFAQEQENILRQKKEEEELAARKLEEEAALEYALTGGILFEMTLKPYLIKNSHEDIDGKIEDVYEESDDKVIVSSICFIY